MYPSQKKVATIFAVAVRSLQPLPPSSSQSPFPAFNFKPSDLVYVSSNSKWMNPNRNLKSVRARASASGCEVNLGDALGEVDILTATGELVLFKDLWDQKELPFPLDCLYADPERKAKVFSRLDSLQNAMKNYSIGATLDDKSGVLQQGGMFVFKGKQLLYVRKDEGTGDHAPLDDIFDVCCKVPAS